MKTINLRDYYPSIYEEDEYLEVPDDIAELMEKSEKARKAYVEYLRYHKAYYSLDCGDAIETAAVHRPKEPLQILLERELSREMRQALSMLTPTDRRRFILHSLAMQSKSAIAKKEGVSEGAVRKSIQRAKDFLKNYFENF